MSIALLITSADGKDTLFPIATEAIFSSYWLPIIEEHNLQFLRLFQTGLPVEKEDIPYILDEIKIFRNNLSKTGQQSSIINERLDAINEQLQLLVDQDFDSIYIG
ncbi:hypothetical protein [Herpetosiphon geysericola]|uniref:hypothetical protein n=1 Tax=Herpetosiphon geysericola TaxID=70996 RepID=UPI0006C9065F|nr:hypothetical protein [Herpetosiphon geysericola]